MASDVDIAAELFEDKCISFKIVATASDCVELQKSILGRAPEYLHSKRYGDLYRPSYYYYGIRYIDSSKARIRFTNAPDTPIAVASVLHHRETRRLFKSIEETSNPRLVVYLKHFDPWVFDMTGMYARFIPGRFWCDHKEQKRTPFTVRFAESRDNSVAVPPDAYLFVVILNLGRKPRLYEIHDPEYPEKDFSTSVSPGAFIMFRQGIVVKTLRMPDEPFDQFGLELTAYWVFTRNREFLNQCFNEREYFSKQSPTHYVPLFEEEQGSKLHMLHGNRSRVNLVEIGKHKADIREWSRQTFAPFMYSTASNYALQGLVSAAPSLPEIQQKTGFDKATYWDVHYPDYTAEERQVYAIIRLVDD